MQAWKWKSESSLQPNVTHIHSLSVTNCVSAVKLNKVIQYRQSYKSYFSCIIYRIL